MAFSYGKDDEAAWLRGIYERFSITIGGKGYPITRLTVRVEKDVAGDTEDTSEPLLHDGIDYSSIRLHISMLCASEEACIAVTKLFGGEHLEDSTQLDIKIGEDGSEVEASNVLYFPWEEVRQSVGEAIKAKKPGIDKDTMDVESAREILALMLARLQGVAPTKIIYAIQNDFGLPDNPLGLKEKQEGPSRN